MRTNRHIYEVTKSPRMAQTVQQLKYDTLLVYLTNGINLVFGSFASLGEVSNSLQGLITVLPYKNFYGGGTTSGGGGTS
ncbi:MAG: hypothetical protein HUU46_23460 [Candidatus Hydrogenedentes bacterium]|nr:hypothetical protein [Candidatus Hydrogenedentota bacterium]